LLHYPTPTYTALNWRQMQSVEIAKAYVSETPEDFGLERLADFGDTRSELVAITLKYEEAMIQQKPFARLIEEIRLLDFGSDLEEKLNADMMVGLAEWISKKPAAEGLSQDQLAALIINVFGVWGLAVLHLQDSTES